MGLARAAADVLRAAAREETELSIKAWDGAEDQIAMVKYYEDKMDVTVGEEK